MVTVVTTVTDGPAVTVTCAIELEFSRKFAADDIPVGRDALAEVPLDPWATM